MSLLKLNGLTTICHPWQNSKRKRVDKQPYPKQGFEQLGFTLIEVMVALAILSVVAIVASQASGTYLRSVDNLKTRTLAHFVAQNTAANLQITPQVVQSPVVNTFNSQGRDWQVTIAPVSADTVSNSSNLTGSASESTQLYNSIPNLSPVNIQVSSIADANVSEPVLRPVNDLTVLLLSPSNAAGTSVSPLTGSN